MMCQGTTQGKWWLVEESAQKTPVWKLLPARMPLHSQ